MNAVYEKLPSNVECDFCSAPGAPVRRYPAEDFEMLTPPSLGVRTNSVGAWGACAACAELIDAERWQELEARAIAGYQAARGEKLGALARDVVEVVLRDAYAKFRQHRKRTEMATRRVLIRAQNVHDYFLAHYEEHGWNDLKTFFCIRPPFPEMVISYDHEFLVPEDRTKRMLRHVDVVATSRSVDYFAHYYKVEACSGDRDAVELRGFVEDVQPNSLLEIRVAMDTVEVPGRWFLLLDERGQVLTRGEFGWLFVKSPAEDARIAAASASTGRDMQDWTTGVIGKHGAIACATLQFMNCRNVEVVDNPPTRQMRRAAERAGKRPPVTYKTLVIHPAWKQRVYRRGAPVLSSATSLHICRGHFKNFTSGPGLGRAHAHGVWWWSPQVRGSESVGRVEKDYEVAER